MIRLGIIGLIGLILVAIIYFLSEHDRKRVVKAARSLSIPEPYVQTLDYLLLAIYKQHPDMYRESDERFLARLQLENPKLLAQIQHKLSLLMEEEDYLPVFVRSRDLQMELS